MPRRGAADDSGLVVVSALEYIVAQLKSDDRGRAEALLNMAVKEFRALGSTQFAGTCMDAARALAAEHSNGQFVEQWAALIASACRHEFGGAKVYFPRLPRSESGRRLGE